MSTTVPVEIPISGIRSLRETLGLTRLDERATANDIEHSGFRWDDPHGGPGKGAISNCRDIGYKLSRSNPSLFFTSLRFFMVELGRPSSNYQAFLMTAAMPSASSDSTRS